MTEPSRQAVYDALDRMPAPVFAALVGALFGINRVMALTCIEDPTPNAALEAAIIPHLTVLGWDASKP